MAATKIFNSASLAIQIENGVNSSDETIYRKKSFNKYNLDSYLSVVFFIQKYIYLHSL